MSGKRRVYAAGKNVAYTYVVIPMVEHHGLTQSVQAEFRGVVSRAAGERIFSSQAADVDDRTAGSTLLKPFKSLAAAIERTGEIGFNHAIPFLDLQLSG